MGIYVITVGTTGIGAEVRKKLLDQGHEVFNIDNKGDDYTADLSTEEGRKGAITNVLYKSDDNVRYFIEYGDVVIPVTAYISEVDSEGKILRLDIYPL